MESIVADPSHSTLESVHDAYGEDASNLSAMFVQHADVNADYPAFQNGLSAIAARHGIVDWKNHVNTNFAIGKGLNQAPIKMRIMKKSMSLWRKCDYVRMQDIEKGYTAE